MNQGDFLEAEDDIEYELGEDIVASGGIQDDQNVFNPATSSAA